MSTLAKVFIIFVLIFSVVFFGSSATLFYMRYNWREAYEKNKDQMGKDLQALKDSLKGPIQKMHDVTTENARIKTENANLAAAAKVAQDQVAKLDQSGKDLELTVQKLSVSNSDNQKTIQGQMTDIKGREDQITKLKTDTQNAVESKNKAVKDLTRVAIDLNKAQTEISDLRISLADAHQKIEAFDVLRENLVKNTGINIEDFDVPPIQGLVEAVSAENNLVVLSVGKDQKVLPGYRFAVRRGDTFIGKVEVIEVYEDLSGARITYTDKGAAIQIGDQVATSNL